MTNVQALARDWLDAKHAETVATEKRHAIERELSEALDVPDEGSKTHKIDGFKITMTQPVSRRVFADAWERLSELCPSGLEPVRVKLEADPAKIKLLLETFPDVWRNIAPAFETKPGKIGVKVEET